MRNIFNIFTPQWKSDDQLRYQQNRLLKKTVKYAYKYSPYYKTIMNKYNIIPEDIKDLRDLVNFPITEKYHLQEYGRDNFLSTQYSLEECIKENTSGSTGIPLETFWGKNDIFMRHLLYLRSYIANREKITQKKMIFMTTPFNLPRFWFQRLGVLRTYPISVFDSPDMQIKQLRTIAPDNIFGFPSVLRIVAQEIQNTGNTVKPVKLVYTGGELLHPNTKKIIETSFKARVVNTYNATEIGNIAWECPAEKGLHVNSDFLILECLGIDNKPAPLGTSGQVVITNLFTRAMPLIRYSLGDYVRLKPQKCSCQYNLPLIDLVEGREDDILTFPENRKVSPLPLIYELEYIEGIKSFQVVQESIDNLSIYIVKGKNYSPETNLNIVEKIQNITGHDVYIKIQEVLKIDRKKSGKLTSIISNVKK